MKTSTAMCFFATLALIQLASATQQRLVCNDDEGALTIYVENFENSKEVLIWGNHLDGAERTRVRVYFDNPIFASYGKSSITSDWNMDITPRVPFFSARDVVLFRYSSVYNFGLLAMKESTASDQLVVKVDYKTPGSPLVECTL